MKFSKTLVILALATVGASSFASGKNLVTCSYNDQEDEITIRQDVGGQIVALYSMLDHGTVAYSVTLKPVQPGILGAGVTYEGRGLTLHINTDSPAGKEGFGSTLSIDDLSVQNEQFECRIL